MLLCVLDSFLPHAPVQQAYLGRLWLSASVSPLQAYESAPRWGILDASRTQRPAIGYRLYTLIAPFSLERPSYARKLVGVLFSAKSGPLPACKPSTSTRPTADPFRADSRAHASSCQIRGSTEARQVRAFFSLMSRMQWRTTADGAQ